MLTLLAILAGAFLALVAVSVIAAVVVVIVLSSYDDAIANGKTLPGSLGGSAWPDLGDWAWDHEKSMPLLGTPAGPLGEAIAVAELRRDLADDEEIWAWCE